MRKGNKWEKKRVEVGEEYVAEDELQYNSPPHNSDLKSLHQCHTHKKTVL